MFEGSLSPWQSRFTLVPYKIDSMKVQKYFFNTKMKIHNLTNMYYIQLCVCVCVCVCVCFSGRTKAKWWLGFTVPLCTSWTKEDYKQNGWWKSTTRWQIEGLDGGSPLVSLMGESKEQRWCSHHVLTDITCRCDMLREEGVCVTWCHVREVN